MEDLITDKTPELVNLKFYELCKIKNVKNGENFISEIQPLFITILSDLLQPLKEDNEDRYNSFLHRLVEYYFSGYNPNHSYEMDQTKFISYFKTIIRGPNASEKRIIKEHFGHYKTNRNYLQQTFTYFQNKYNYSSGKDALTFPNQLDFPSFGRLPMSEKRNMTLSNVPKLSLEQKKRKIDAMAAILKLSLIVHKCTQLYQTNSLLSTFTDNELKSIENNLLLKGISADEVVSELKKRQDEEIEEELLEERTNEQKRMFLRDIHGHDVVEEELDLFEEMAIEEENIPVVNPSTNSDGSIVGEANKLFQLNQQGLQDLFHKSPEEIVQYAMAPLLGTGRLAISVFKEQSELLFDKLSAKSVFNWIRRKWDLLGTGITYLACPCGYTTYILEKSDLTVCSNPKCDANDRRIKMRYESIRVFLAFLFLEEKIKKAMDMNRAKHAMNTETLDSVLNGDLYRRSAEKEKEPNTFCFNLGLSMDGCNVHSKTMLNTEVSAIVVLDLPPELRTQKESVFIPTFYKNVANAPGSNREFMKVLMTDLMDLWNEGFKVKLDGVTYTIYANIVTFTGDIPSIAGSLELQFQKALYACSFCKIKKVSTKSGEAPLSFKNLDDNPMITSEELRGLAARREFPTQGSIWKMKGDNMFTVFIGFDFMRSVAPDLMHVALENIHPKRICAALLEKGFKILDKKLFGELVFGINSIKNYLSSKGMFEEPGNLKKFFTPEAAGSRLKAVDSKLFCHAFPLMVKCNLGLNNIHSEILGYLTEINHHLICFMAEGVPREDIPLLKNNYIQLMKKLEDLSKKYSFLNVVSCVPTHYVIHMFEKWCDVGSYVDTWCFPTERACKDTKNLAHPGRHTMTTLGIRLPILLYSKMRAIRNMKFDNMSCYKLKVGDYLTNVDKLGTLLNQASRKFGISDRKLISVYELDYVTIRSLKLKLDDCQCFAKIKNGKEWSFIKVMRILRFNYDGKDLLAIKYADMEIITPWIPCITPSLEKCLHPEIKNVSKSTRWMWLDNDVNITPISGLPEHDKMVLDVRPHYGMMFRRKPSVPTS